MMSSETEKLISRNYLKSRVEDADKIIKASEVYMELRETLLRKYGLFTDEELEIRQNIIKLQVQELKRYLHVNGLAYDLYSLTLTHVEKYWLHKGMKAIAKGHIDAAVKNEVELSQATLIGFVKDYWRNKALMLHHIIEIDKRIMHVHPKLDRWLKTNVKEAI